MSRSNGPGVPPNGWPADYRPAEAQDPYADPYYTQQQQPPQQRPAAPPTQHPVARVPRIQTAPPSRSPQTGLPQGGVPPGSLNQGGPMPPQYAPPQGHGAPQGYGQPQYGQPQQAAPPYAPPQYAPPPHKPQAYAPPARPQAPVQHQSPPPSLTDPRYGAYSGYDAPTGRPTQPAYPPTYTAPPAPQAPPLQAQGPQAYVPETTGRPTQPPRQPPPRASTNFDQWPPQSPQATAVQNSDPNAYDLGTYMPQVNPDPRSQRPTAPTAWAPHIAPEQARQPLANPSYPAQYPADLHSGSQALEPVGHEDEYEELEEDEGDQDAPRKTRYGLIAASFIAAIAVGGGLAYAYKMFATAPTQMAATPVVKSGTGPVKVKPADPGGTKFANADSKMMESLGGTSGNEGGDGGPKVVKTMTIERNGTISSGDTGASAPSAAALAPLTSSPGVPGMILAGVPPTQPPAAAPVTVQPPPAQRPAPRVIAAASPAPDAADVSAIPAAPPAVKKILPAAKKVVAPSAVGGPATGANGFVAVLASVPASANSRVQAMQQYADLQQKFGGVLGSKAPDVVEAKLEKGTFHRLIVGPPGSRDAAGSVCTQLKAAGYTADCWVTAF